jgi:hypothetical protein
MKIRILMALALAFASTAALAQIVAAPPEQTLEQRREAIRESRARFDAEMKADTKRPWDGTRPHIPAQPVPDKQPR